MKFANPVHAAALAAYPVGSIYMSANATNPGTLFGGTWERIQGRFLFAADSSHAAGSTGGEAEVTLEKSQIPEYLNVTYVDGNSGPNPGIAGSVVCTGSNWSGIVSCPLNNGGGQSHNNMPPYLSVYIWKRTA